ncbi:multicopper oxidase family protein [Paludisphaera mucosa]|uniref:Multicopper oxidase domain-containing protein n=1 Tax=Paludisphaera mucosa TaxID=3030827 RepID=A0ABT6F9Z0_9BACT|nr:multicopper oxidase domain-containing protein [Paludisphaera mucosa]MDG3004379.1 multicopper oxidase domain-containing protein [Paludisphaera mucosa]
MLDRRTFLRATTAVPGFALITRSEAGEEPTGPFSNPTRTFDPKDLDAIPNWAFSLPFHHIPTIRPCRIATFEALQADKFIIHESDPVPIGEVFHGIASEWWNSPRIWKAFFGCDPAKVGLAAWQDKQRCFGTFAHHKTGRPLKNWGEFPVKCYKVPIREAAVKLRPDGAAEARVYTYGDLLPGPLFRHRIGQPAVVRFENQLETEVSIHLHGGHSPSHSDGFPSFYVLQNKARDYFYPHILPLRPEEADQAPCELPLRDGTRKPGYDPKLGRGGGPGHVPDMAEAQSTMWYHDHAMDATGYNVSKGLASMCLCFSEPELWLIANNILPNDGEKSCFDPEEQGPGCDEELEDPDRPGHYLRGKEPFHNPYDIPMVLQDKIIDRETGQIAFDTQGHNGYLGTTMFVNGVPWPTLTVENRKYRFRILDGSNARIFRLRFLAEEDYIRARDGGMTSDEYDRCSKEFLQIGKDTWLWSEPLPQTSVVLAMAKRVDLVFDFTERGCTPLFRKDGDEVVPLPAAKGKPGGRVFYLVNTMPQNDGRGPKANLEVPEDPRMQALPFETDAFKLTELNKPIPLLRFCVEGDPLPIEKEAEVAVGVPLIRPRRRIDDADVRVVREFVFHRGKGFWMVNKRFYDPTISNASPVLGSAEEWVLRNGGGGWWHPIHIHLEGHQIVAYLKDFAADALKDAENATTLKPLSEMTDVTHAIHRTELIANHDTQILGPNTAVRIRMRFRTWPGPFVFHCHNLEHEDMRMMFNFEPVPDETYEPPTRLDPLHHDPDAAPTARTHGNDLTMNGYDKDKNPDGRMGELPWELYPVPITPVERGGEFLIPPRKK